MEQRPWSVFERWGQPVIYERGRMVYWQEEIADCFYYLKVERCRCSSAPKTAEKKP